MHPLIEEIIHTLAHPSSAPAREEALVLAAFIFEKASGADPCTWRPQLVDATFNDAEVLQLKQSLLLFAEREARGAYALSKCHDHSLKPTLVHILRRQLHGDANELYQAMIALANLGESVFQTATSASIRDSEINRQLAKAYLQQIPPT